MDTVLWVRVYGCRCMGRGTAAAEGTGPGLSYVAFLQALWQRLRQDEPTEEVDLYRDMRTDRRNEETAVRAASRLGLP